MSRRKKDKRSRRFFGLFSDPWRKLVSIGLALLLWNYLHARLTKVHIEDVPMVYNADSLVDHVAIRLDTSRYSLKQFLNGDTREPVTKVTLRLEGPNRVIEDLKKVGQLAFEVRLAEGNVNAGTPQNPPFIVFRLEDVHHKNPEYDWLLREMTPRAVRVELNRNQHEVLVPSPRNVTLVILDGDESIKDRLKEPRFIPERVQIFGEEAALENINADSQLFVCTVNARTIKNQQDITLPLELAPELASAGIKIDPMPTVRYKIDAGRITYFLQNVPVVIDYSHVGIEEARKWQITPATVNYRVKVSVGSDLDAELFNFYKAGQPECPVDESWSRENAQFRVVLREADRASPTHIERRPSIRLFKLDQLDKETPFLLGPDYIPGDDRPFIKIERTKKP